MRAVLFDLDGVIYQDGKAIDGAVATLHWVLEQSIPHLFVTNTTSRPRHRIAEQLQDYDLDIEPDRILTPPIAACHWLCRQQTSHIALFVPEATRADFADFHTLDEDTVTGADAVILGDLGEAWDFARLNRAFRLLQAKPECALLALGMTRYWRAPDGLRLDTGPFVRAILKNRPSCSANPPPNSSTSPCNSWTARPGKPSWWVMTYDRILPGRNRLDYGLRWSERASFAKPIYPPA